jgi:hypothetical protein
MSESDGSISSFVTWARSNLPRLRDQPSQAVADELGERLLQIDPQLGVEVADDVDESREVIITAFSEPKLFPLVHRITTLLSDLSGWEFTALKPPRGFAFQVKIGDTKIDAKTLAFAPAPDVDAGIRLILPRNVADELRIEPEATELAWLVVETGIGEELAARLEQVEFHDETGGDLRFPIENLESFVRDRWPPPP